MTFQSGALEKLPLSKRQTFSIGRWIMRIDVDDLV
jgi:hypothetical protein